MTLFDRLSQYSRSGALPMHMPGHKRNVSAFPWLSGLAERDITEIQGFDNLNDPEGLFRDLETGAAALWGASDSVCLVNGSTLGILAAVLSQLERGRELLMCRDCHMSVYHAAQLARAATHYLVPKRHPELNIPLSVTPEEVASALELHPQTRLVCVTSPTYQGVISDIKSIAGVCHKKGVPLLVDEAHGAHLGFAGFPAGAVRLGADIVVQSLHKTLPSLTQTAMLHINEGLVDPAQVRRYVGMLQSSSPSYLLSASVDACVRYMRAQGDASAERWLLSLRDFRRGAAALKNIRLWEGGDGVFALDPSKLLLISSPGLAGALRDRYRIEPEYAQGHMTLCMTGMGDMDGSLAYLLRALYAVGRTLPAYLPEKRPPLPLPRQALPIDAALRLPGGQVPLEDAVGRVSGDYVWSYPPGVPLIVPGEVIDRDVSKFLAESENLRSTHKCAPNSIFCVDLP